MLLTTVNTLMLRALLLYYSQELWSVRSHSMALKMVDVASCSMFRQKCRASAAFTAECLMTNKTAWGYTSAQIRHGIVWDETIHFFRHLHDCCAMFCCGMNIDIFLAHSYTSFERCPWQKKTLQEVVNRRKYQSRWREPNNEGGQKNHYWFFCFCFSYLWHSCLVKTAPQVISTFLYCILTFDSSQQLQQMRRPSVSVEREAGDAVLILVQSRKKSEKREKKKWCSKCLVIQK